MKVHNPNKLPTIPIADLISFDTKDWYNIVMKCKKCGLGKELNKVCRPCKAISDRIWRQNNKEKVAKYFREKWKDPERKKANKLYKERHRFGIDAELFVKNKNCYGCGISNTDYKAKNGRRLDINHIDDNGRRALRMGDNPNNKPENFMVVCRSCHVSWHNKNVRKYNV